MATFKPFLLLISLLALALVSSSIPLPGLNKGAVILCDLGFNVKTLSNPCAGTTSNVSIEVTFRGGGTVTIPNLVEWNLRPPPPAPWMGYFRPGQLDTLAALAVCFANMPCNLTITITGTGHCPTWGLEYIQVNSSKYLQTFQVNKWLTPENNYNVFVSKPCHGFSKGMPGSTKGSLAI